ncbi:hypothetical protein AB685_19255 [Bacillus sp. LL01]|uniref:hypothetical protein n=1 Tax=Bacillus sp. LL01 TaxID=1665556 RepID=UPI00064D677E|nr:hypothetical protein [Bacillus sp. LL01]KMJ56865.1 hypothetical protein AB685_19255 [Bacillus sp. LL01]
MNNMEKKHVYLMYAMGSLLLLPLYILVGPFIFQGVLFDDKTIWLLQESSDTYWLYAVSGVLLALFFFMAFLFVKYAKWLVGVGIIAALFFFALGTFSYQALGSETISWSATGTFKTNQYTWEDVKEVVLVLPKHGEKHKMVFYFNDGNELSMIRDHKFTLQLYQFNYARWEHNFPYTVDRTNQF